MSECIAPEAAPAEAESSTIAQSAAEVAEVRQKLEALQEGLIHDYNLNTAVLEQFDFRTDGNESSTAAIEGTADTVKRSPKSSDEVSQVRRSMEALHAELVRDYNMAATDMSSSAPTRAAHSGKQSDMPLEDARKVLRRVASRGRSASGGSSAPLAVEAGASGNKRLPPSLLLASSSSQDERSTRTKSPPKLVDDNDSVTGSTFFPGSRRGHSSTVDGGGGGYELRRAVKVLARHGRS
eukprot:gnl/TRDRNA2_/TRDRNA2_92255_c0_seq1.p1 gnl/TRDRNA2_/TRDRNA2_92255_c0~~gnl/TRDRNA2_/TRDRNA2_92255_c0_seq1.p1  ORF type:complete len:238 (+),score=45.66 gnl/TRDRNA2_/TRDRNA2_92255_c0_seq1:61-774(+)